MDIAHCTLGPAELVRKERYALVREHYGATTCRYALVRTEPAIMVGIYCQGQLNIDNWLY